LLLRAICPRLGAGRAALHHATEEGIAYDLYEPAAAARRTFVLLYGLSLAGEQDARLVRLARAYLGSGFRVAVPSLAGLKTFRFDRGDKRAITDLVAHLHRRHGGRIGITGFSAGAGMALAAAADPAVADLIDPLMLFGPYYSLADLWTAWQACDVPASNRGKDWDCFIWTRMVSAFRHRDSLGLAPDEERELVDLLRDYCTGTPLRRKREFYERVLRGRNVHLRNDAPPDERTLQELSPRGRMNHLSSRVLILHDSTDRLIPPDHSQRIVEELCRRRGPDAQKLLITPLMSHVSPASVWRILDALRIVRLVGEIFVG